MRIILIATLFSLVNLVNLNAQESDILIIKGGKFNEKINKEEEKSINEFNELNSFINSRLRNEIYYDYKLKSNSPKVNGENYNVEIELGIKANKKMFSFFSDLYKVLKKISIEGSDINFRTESNLSVFKIQVFNGSTYYLRNKSSFDLLKNLDKLLYLKSGDFYILTNPKYNMPSSEYLIKSKIIANNFIIINRQKSPNPGVYWSWLPYEYTRHSQKIHDNWTGNGNNFLMLSDFFLKNIPKQSDLNDFSEHMGSVLDNGRTDYNLVIRSELIFNKNDFELLESIQVTPTLNNLCFVFGN